MQTFLDRLPLAKEKMLDQIVQTTVDAARLSDQVLPTTFHISVQIGAVGSQVSHRRWPRERWPR